MIGVQLDQIIHSPFLFFSFYLFIYFNLLTSVEKKKCFCQSEFLFIY
jgi:hypothetical protein